jgi:hypothetical protein
MISVTSIERRGTPRTDLGHEVDPSVQLTSIPSHEDAFLDRQIRPGWRCNASNFVVLHRANRETGVDHALKGVLGSKPRPCNSAPLLV